MNDSYIIDLIYEVLKTMGMVGGPILLGSLVIGVLVSFFQAITQINEQTLTFIPKILVIGVSLVVFGPWILDVMVSFTRDLFLQIPELAQY